MAWGDALGRRGRIVAVAVAGLAAGFGLPTVGRAAQQGVTAITCTNPVSGTSWQIAIDYGAATVDANPAEITAAAISWFDPRDGGHYRLDRGSGELTATVASSTGGYFRHGRCRLEPSR